MSRNMTRDRWLTAWALASVALGGASLLVPLYFVAVGGDAVLLGVLAGVAALAGAPGALVVGRLADRTGRRRAYVLGGLVLVTVVLAVMPFTRDEGVLLVANAVVWFAAGGLAPVLTLLVTVGHPESRWSERFAVLNAYGGWGWAGGLLLGTLWTVLAVQAVAAITALRTLFVVLALCAGGATALASERLPADPGPIDERRASRLGRAIRRARRVPVRSATFPVSPGRLYWLTRSTHPRELWDRFTPDLTTYFGAVLAVFVGFGAFWGPLPLFFVREGYAGPAVFAIYLLSSLGAAVSFRPAGRYAADNDPATVQSVALFGRALLQPGAFLVALVAATGLVGFLLYGLVFAAVGVAWAVVAVTATPLVGRLAPARIRGEALGVYVAVSGIGTGIGSLVGGWLAGTGGFGRALGVSGLLVLLGTAFVWWLRGGGSGDSAGAEALGPASVSAAAGEATDPEAATDQESASRS